MTLHTWLGFVAVAVAVSVLPGPAVFTIITTALRGGFRASLAANAGVLAGNAVYVIAAASGLGAILVASHTLFVCVRWAGIAYLAYLGIRALLDRETQFAPGVAVPQGHAWRIGLTTQLANPKIMLFFGALLPQFVDAHKAIAPQFAILGATFIASDAVVFVVYAALAHRARTALASPRAKLLLSRITGVAMVGAAARLAAER